MSKFAKLVMFTLAIVLSSTASAAKTGQGAAPDFTLKSKSGDNLKLSEQRGDVIMLNFWASWCGPCRQEMPLLEDIQKKYSKYGFSIWGVNVDKDSKKADKLLQKIPVSFPILYDPKSSVSELYKVDAMPTTVMIDRNGNWRLLHRGYKPGDEKGYEAEIKKLIRE